MLDQIPQKGDLIEIQAQTILYNNLDGFFSYDHTLNSPKIAIFVEFINSAAKLIVDDSIFYVYEFNLNTKIKSVNRKQFLKKDK